MIKTLSFKNLDACERLTHIKMEEAAMSDVSEWYHAFYAGDRITVFVNNKKQKVDLNGCFLQEA